MLTKKGVSPLIATVLLLAFAVALATVIIQLEPFSKCTLSEVTIKNIGGQQKVCFNNKTNSIEMFIENNDKKDVVGFKVTVTGTEKPLNIGSIALNIGRNEEGKLIFDYDPAEFGDILEISIYPQINRSNRLQECGMKEEISSVPFCT